MDHSKAVNLTNRTDGFDNFRYRLKYSFETNLRPFVANVSRPDVHLFSNYLSHGPNETVVNDLFTDDYIPYTLLSLILLLRYARSI